MTLHSSGRALTRLKKSPTAGGDRYCWGGNSFGAVGDGTTKDVPTPTLLP
jgi:hypothetical protein